jgi:8-oxo-dGTP diphosphatase
MTRNLSKIMSRENRMIKGENGEELWISRSVVVICVVARITDDNKIEIIAEKRGPLVSATGRWCFPCGYLDYDEDLTDAVIREVQEETGYTLERKDVNFIDINSKPEGKKQNVGIRHIAFIDNDKKQISDFELDTNEVTELKWIEIGESVGNIFNIDVNKLDCVKWAFNHKSLIIHIINEYCNRYGYKIELKNKQK